MTLSVAEMYLVVWASFMTLLYLISKHDAKNFKQFTVYKLRQVAILPIKREDEKSIKRVMA